MPAHARSVVQVIVLIAGSALLTGYGLVTLGGWGELRRIVGSEMFNLWKPLVPDGQFKVIGRTMPRLDIPSKVNGSAVFGLDVRFPGMKYAAVRLAPKVGQTLATVGTPPAGVQVVRLLDRVEAQIARMHDQIRRIGAHLGEERLEIGLEIRFAPRQMRVGHLNQAERHGLSLLARPPCRGRAPPEVNPCASCPRTPPWERGSSISI